MVQHKKPAYCVPLLSIHGANASKLLGGPLVRVDPHNSNEVSRSCFDGVPVAVQIYVHLS